MRWPSGLVGIRVGQEMVAGGFNQRKPSHRTVCVAVELIAAFDTVCHNTDMQDCKINTSVTYYPMAVMLPPW